MHTSSPPNCAHTAPLSFSFHPPNLICLHTHTSQNGLPLPSSTHCIQSATTTFSPSPLTAPPAHGLLFPLPHRIPHRGLGMLREGLCSCQLINSRIFFFLLCIIYNILKYGTCIGACRPPIRGRCLNLPIFPFPDVFCVRKRGREESSCA